MNFLNFLMKQNTVVIEVLITITLFILLFAAYRSFILEKEEPRGSMVDRFIRYWRNSEESLEKTSADVSVGSPDTGRFVAEIDNLRSELNNKKIVIEELQAKLESTGSAPSADAGMDSAEQAQLEKEAANLRAKLSEYEILLRTLQIFLFIRSKQ